MKKAFILNGHGLIMSMNSSVQWCIFLRTCRITGGEMAKRLCNAALLTNLDLDGADAEEMKKTIAIRLIQTGIDFTGIADNGGGWPANGGHGMG